MLRSYLFCALVHAIYSVLCYFCDLIHIALFTLLCARRFLLSALLCFLLLLCFMEICIPDLRQAIRASLHPALLALRCSVLCCSALFFAVICSRLHGFFPAIVSLLCALICFALLCFVLSSLFELYHSQLNHSRMAASGSPPTSPLNFISSSFSSFYLFIKQVSAL